MKIESLRLHHYPVSRSARAAWAAHEAGAPLELVRVDVYNGRQYEADYLALNPNHSVPTLEVRWEDGSSLTMVESAAMVAFLADAYPEAGLAPAPGASKARADYLTALHFCGTQADMALWQIRLHEHVLAEPECDARTAARYRAKFQREVEPQLAARLAKGGYISGDAFSAADCVAGHIVLWARGYGLCQDEAFARYLSAVTKRAGFLKAFADSGEFRIEPARDSVLRAKANG